MVIEMVGSLIQVKPPFAALKAGIAITRSANQTDQSTHTTGAGSSVGAITDCEPDLPGPGYALRTTPRQPSLRQGLLILSSLPSRSSPATARLRPLGFGAAAFSRFASEGWWGKKDSNLRSHKTADLQSAPFATRDTPPLNPIASPPAGMATDMAIDDVKTGRRWRTPGRAVYGGIAMAKSTNGRRLIRAARGSNCHNAEPVTQASHGRS
jgi:hypothetical protein